MIEEKSSPEPSLSLTELDLLLSMEGWGDECVKFVRMHLGDHPDFRGNAIEIQPNTDTPRIGHAVLTSESDLGHVAIVTNIQDDYIVVSESNYVAKDRISHGRKIPKDSHIIRGYFDFSTAGTH